MTCSGQARNPPTKHVNLDTYDATFIRLFRLFEANIPFHFPGLSNKQNTYNTIYLHFYLHRWYCTKKKQAVEGTAVKLKPISAEYQEVEMKINMLLR